MARGRLDGGSPQDAKNLLDSIGEKVYKEKVQSDRKTYTSELHGDLSLATTIGELVGTADPCTFEYDKLINGSGSGGAARGDPCESLSGKDAKKEERFSNTLGGQCTNSKMRSGCEGACAPYRRLHVCDKNMVKMDTNNYSKAKHDLLAEVCYAAKFEGESIRGDHDKYKQSNSSSQLCTALARSFADIGDIVRGKDLFLGNSVESAQRDKLEKNLKEIFAKIHSGLSTKNGVKDRYQNDGDNYYKLREDWWTANRETVWKAMTCKADASSAYFRPTCDSVDGKGPSVARNQCRCDGANTDPPTYFDYVPQYLRWFEEWAEDFCRKKNKKLEDVKRNCRDETEKYCSGNGYDCTKTIYKKGKLVIGSECTNCSVWCRLYEKWIDNQKKEFLKQKNKYQTEISNSGSCGGSGSSRKKRSSGSDGNKYDGYEKQFYEEFKRDYGKVDDFLELLNNEKECKGISEVKEIIDFKTVDNGFDKNINSQGTFYHSEYCQPCPYCGVKREGKEWKNKSETDQCNIKLYKPRKDAPHTPINILKSGEKHDDIKQKIDDFCTKTQIRSDGSGGGGGGNSDSSLYDPWQCYEFKHLEKDKEGEDDDEYDRLVETGGGLCILPNPKKNKKHESGNNSSNEPAEFQKTFNEFFYFWIGRFLNDSMYWRGKVNSCINNAKRKKCRNGCNNDCDCFAKWVVKKKTEWTQIKEHFKTQDFGNQGENGGIEMLGEAMKSPDFVLENVLKLEDLFNNIKSGYGNAKELKGINKILDEEQKKNKEEEADGETDNENKNTIDKLLKHEGDEAETCKNCEPPEEQESLARSATSPDTPASPTAATDNHDNAGPPAATDDDEDDEEEEEEEEKATKEDTGSSTEEGSPAPTTEKSVDACGIVSKLFSGNDFKDACTLKYNKGKNYGWRCVPTNTNEGATGGEGSEATGERGNRSKRHTDSQTPSPPSGSICVPPRRRRLYIQKLHDWAEKYTGNTQAESPQGGEAQTQAGGKAAEGTQASASSSPSDSNSVQTTLNAASSTSTTSSSQLLRQAFIQSAAVETFFLWDRYKKEWEQRNKPQNGLLLGTAPPLPTVPVASSDDSNPQNQLANGTIPTDFLRLMFYTLGDYRDILFSGDKGEKSGYNDILRGDNVIKEREKKIKETIDKVFPNNDSSSSPSGGPQTQRSDKRTALWGDFAQYIWNGMVCALTYKENSSGGEKNTTITHDEKVKGQLLENGKNTPKNSQYQYQTAKLEEKNSGANAPASPASASGEKTTLLSEFVKRPPYFRYLEEWGQNFCKERKKRLEKIKEDCYKDGITRQYSGDGEACDRTDTTNGVFADLENASCAISCRLYKKWIKKKRTEYDKQKEEYNNQKENVQNNNGFYTRIQNCNEAKDFLQKLGPCSKNENGVRKPIFDKETETFGHEKYCDPCPKFKIDCTKANCGGDTKGKCNGSNGKKNGNDYITASDIENGGNSTKILDMRVSDKSKNGSQNGLEDCISSGIFKGIRKDEWLCDNVCGLDVCKPKNNNNGINNQQIILMNALVAHWVHNFLEDYNKIKHKISHCINNSDENKCKYDCPNKCKCVKEWVEEKKNEWKTLKDRFNEQYKSETSGDYPVRSFLETWIPQITDANDKKQIIKLSQFDTSCGCSAKTNSENNKNEDAIECMLDRLQQKIGECEKKHGEKSVQTCSPSETPENNPPLPDDEEHFLEETEENPVKAPNICPTQQEEVKEKDECKASQSPAVPEQAAQKPATPSSSEEQTPKEEAPARNVAPEPAPIPPPADQPFDPTILQTTIPFGIAIALTSIVFLFLKKKTQSPVDLFSVINIPKSDYDIPTKLSPNRYIPYTSGKYRGKRYIYLEGDSGTDSGYTDHYSDITSSESEYEEMEINDIYVPGSPKYKTLIEVVLEPSGKNTTASGNNTPTSGNNTTASGKNTPSDTQNDIQNDGIPSSKITDNEWNTLKHDFISNMLQNTQNKEPNMLGYNVDNNTNPKTLHVSMDEKPFIMFIQDRNLLNGEEYNYNVNMVNSMDDPKYVSNNVYSGIDLINDSLSGNKHIDIYDEMLKRKENELFGTNHVKHTTINRFAKPARDDPIHNQLELFHKWLDRHRDMCEQWENHHERLAKLKELWENETHSGNTHPSDSNKTLNTDVSIQIHMDNPKSINQFTNMDSNPNQVDDTYVDSNPDNCSMDTILDDLDKYNDPYYDVQDDIYYDVNDETPSVEDIPMDHNKVDVPSKVQIEMDVNTKLVKEKYPIADVWDI